MQPLEAQLPSYLTSLADFVARHDLPTEWFGVPDHVAYKCADGAAFEAFMDTMLVDTQQLSYIELDNRRLGAAHLTLPISVGEYGAIEWVEIMEPRPERQGSDVVGLEHMEFYFPDFAAVQAVLEDNDVNYELQDNPNHEWINIVINDRGQELKITNGTLAHIVEDELEQEVALLW